MFEFSRGIKTFKMYADAKKMEYVLERMQNKFTLGLNMLMITLFLFFHETLECCFS